MLAILLALAATDPALDQAQTCRAHMELLIEDVAREGGHIAGPTWFISTWWTMKAVEAGAPEDDETIISGLKEGLATLRENDPPKFDVGRQDCVDTAIDAGAVPGMEPG